MILTRHLDAISTDKRQDIEAKEKISLYLL